VVAASVVLLAGCSGSSTADDGRIHVVASTNVYGSIAEAIGGDAVGVTSLIASAAQDPHEFEASARDQLRVSEADVVIENGGGYDPFMQGLISASGSKAQVVTAVDLSQKFTPGGNEHVFYDPATVAALADDLAARFAKLDPSGADTFTANAHAFGAGIDRIEATLAAIDKKHHGSGVFVTEPLPLYLTEAAGLRNLTPAAFSEAVEAGQDVAPAILLEALKIVASDQALVVIVNEQAGGSESDRVQRAAKDASTPVLAFSELVPDGDTYLTWMQGNADALARALG
jgi:zinc/manganese transport system substrate-binding protein